MSRHTAARRALTILLSSISLGLSHPSVAAQAPRLPIEAFFGQPNLSRPRLSPDGTKIAFLFPHEGRMALGVYDRNTRAAQMLIQGRDESLLGFFWKGNERIVFYADFEGNESAFVAATDLTGKKVVRLVETQGSRYLGGSAGGIVDALPLDPERIVMSGLFRPSAPRPGESSITDIPLSLDFKVAKVNVRSRAISTLYTFGTERTQSVVVDNTGTLRLRCRLEYGADQAFLVWEHRENEGRPWRQVARHPQHGYAEEWDPLEFTADNHLLYLVSRGTADRGALHAFDTRTLELGPPLFVPPAGEITSIILSPDRTRLLGVAYEAERTECHWFDAEQAGLHRLLANSLPGLDVRIVSTSLDNQVHLVWAGSDREPGVYFVLDRTSGRLETFKRVRDIDPAALRPMTPVAFQARDGVALHGYLTLPAQSAAGTPVPLIVHPHGGPYGVRDSWGFNADVQFLANRGYAVLQVNFRGSGGYGRSFVTLGRHQWGRAMQDDLSDGVKWAIAQGFADPGRIAIYGASYGGYAALAGVTLTPELYACAINYVGAADLEITFKNLGDDAYMDERDERFSYRTRWVGPDKAYRDATSPVKFIDRIRVPTLHAYGRNDPRVKIDHWNRLEPLLKKHGKPYVSIRQDDQGHGFRDEKAALSFYGAVEKFLEQHLGAPATR